MSRSGALVGLGALLWIGAVAFALLHAGVAGEGPPRLVPMPGMSCPDPALGVNSTLAYEGDGQRRAARVAAIHQLLGAQVVRDYLLWNQVEPVEGQRDWSGPDAVVEELRAAGIEPILLVLGSPSWATGVPESTPGSYLYVPPRGPALESWLKHYSDFLAAAVRRYGAVVKRWEIWNEPNLAEFWRPRPDPIAYRQVYETLRATILTVEPHAQIAVGGLGDISIAPEPDISGLAFLRALMRTRSPLGNVAIHPYSTNDHPPDVRISGENNFEDIARVHDQLVAGGERASIWVTEWGWSSAAVGAVRQAQYVDRSLAMLEHRYPFVRVATYFLDRDRPRDFFQGLLDQNLKPKPVAFAFRAHARRLAAQCHLRRAGS
jgi:hypothetical protein